MPLPITHEQFRLQLVDLSDAALREVHTIYCEMHTSALLTLDFTEECRRIMQDITAKPEPKSEATVQLEIATDRVNLRRRLIEREMCHRGFGPLATH